MATEWTCAQCEADNYFCGCDNPMADEIERLEAKVEKLEKEKSIYHRYLEKNGYGLQLLDISNFLDGSWAVDELLAEDK